MRICIQQELLQGENLVGVLRIYVEGSGNPEEEHRIVGVSLDDQAVGQVDPADEVVPGPAWAVKEVREALR